METSQTWIKPPFVACHPARRLVSARRPRAGLTISASPESELVHHPENILPEVAAHSCSPPFLSRPADCVHFLFIASATAIATSIRMPSNIKLASFLIASGKLAGPCPNIKAYQGFHFWRFIYGSSAPPDAAIRAGRFSARYRRISSKGHFSYCFQLLFSNFSPHFEQLTS